MLTSWYPRVTKPLCVSQPIVNLLLGNNDDKDDNDIGDTVYDDDVLLLQRLLTVLNGYNNDNKRL